MNIDFHRREQPFHPIGCTCADCTPHSPADQGDGFGFREWLAWCTAGLIIGGFLDLFLDTTGLGPRLAHWLGLI